MTYNRDEKWSALTIQPLAKAQVYSQVWPNCQIVALDTDKRNELKRILDISGADKLLRWPDGGISFLAQRFRRHNGKHDDFTLRRHRPSGRKTEAHKVLAALERHRLLAAFYAYGHVNESESGFSRFRILNFTRFAELWRDGQLPPAGWRMNPDGSSSFFYWPFKAIPSELFIYNSEPVQLNLF